MDVLVVAILGGLSYGVVLFLVGMGLSLVLGLMGIVNAAHGALFMTGAYLGLAVAKQTGHFSLGLLAGAAIGAAAGLVIERGLLSRLYNHQLEQILVTFGFVYIVTNFHLWVYGPRPKSAFVPQVLAGSIEIGQFTFPVYRIAIIFAGGLLCLGLWYLQEKTRVGSIIRAGMDDPQMTRGLGINLTPVNVGAFCLGACLAGFAGVAGAPVLGGTNLATGTEMFFTAIAVCIVGGVGSVQGALVGALLIGVSTILVGTYVPSMATYVTYILMVIVLLFTPSGLLGRK